MQEQGLAVVGSIHASFYVKVKRFLRLDETVVGDGYAVYLGQEANRAVGCARLGVEAYVVGAVGNDYVNRVLIISRIFL